MSTPKHQNDKQQDALNILMQLDKDATYNAMQKLMSKNRPIAPHQSLQLLAIDDTKNIYLD